MIPWGRGSTKNREKQKSSEKTGRLDWLYNSFSYIGASVVDNGDDDDDNE